MEQAINKGARYLRQRQQPAGGWPGAWGVCFTYGTWFAVRGLLAAIFGDYDILITPSTTGEAPKDLKAIEGDPPYLDACSSLVMVHLRLGKEEVAVRMAEWAMAERGCTPTPDFVAQYALALAGTGDWARATKVVTEAPGGPQGLSLVLLGAERVLAGDGQAYLAIAKQWRGNAPFGEQVGRLLRLTHQPQAAARLTAWLSASAD